ncbi:MAG: formylglycine-generating enzyme family protein [Thermodesulfobacteriota bacterium]
MINGWDISAEIGSGPPPETIICPIDRAEMVLVPKGHFTMGITQEDLRHVFLRDGQVNQVFATEVPARRIFLEAYYIDRYPVTNYQYHKFIEATGYRVPYLWNHPLWRKPGQPVVFVGWDDARAYATWAGKLLPTEEQWEKAGRGTDGRFWAWGHEFILGRCNSRELGLGTTSEVGLFHTGISPYGCYDMCGNVWEMCEGQWQGGSFPMRGGCFLGSTTFVRITCRWSPEDPDNGAPWLGFRCVKEIPME